ncbi:MAG: hypothetical protein Q7S01_03675 [bacterium]|nr:hypothetical protein [bacterium]
MSVESDKEKEMLAETYRLSRDNNKMLHSMRRSAFWGGVLKVIFWLAIIIAPIWFYSAYLAPIVQSFQNTVNQVQGTGAQAQVQLNGFQDMLKEWGSKVQSALPLGQ